VFDLIRAIKDYSYMDQMPIQEVDIPQSLENTLAMVAFRLGKMEVIRDYEPHLPCVSAYGRELNQVWTALIENALDAVHDEGTIKLLVRTAGDMLLIEVFAACDSLLIGDKCGAHTVPYIEAKNSSTLFEHEATTSKISEDVLFYCVQRGLSQEEAVGLVVNGFVKDVLQQLPMEFAVEAQKLISISLEGSVG